MMDGRQFLKLMQLASKQKELDEEAENLKSESNDGNLCATKAKSLDSLFPPQWDKSSFPEGR